MSDKVKDKSDARQEEGRKAAPERHESLPKDDALSQHTLDEAELNSIAGGKEQKTTIGTQK